MTKKKVLFFIHGLSTGGAETLVKNYFLNFDRNRFETVLLCLNHEKDSPYEDVLKKNEARVICADDYIFCKKKNIFTKVFNHFYRYLIVRKIIRRESPDILHTHLTVNDYVRFARPKRDTIIFHTVHAEPSILWSKKKKGGVKDYKAAKWLIKHNGMRFIVLHEEMRKNINKIFNVSNTIVLNNGIDVNVFKKPENMNTIREQLKIPKKAFVVGHVGRFSEAKNHKFLIDIFIEILLKNEDAILLMVGDGPDKDRIIKILEEKNIQEKYLILSNRDDVQKILSSMDVFVFPSLYEGLPLSLVEAQIARRPCFISDRINERAIISNLVNVLSLDSGPDKWAEEIIKYKKPNKIIVNEDDWDIKKITKELEQIYLNALTEKDNGKK